MNEELIQFILTKAEEESLGKRVRIYRALAPFLPHDQKDSILRICESLEHAQTKYLQFVFDYQ